ncbi:hypothetical protein FA13DRAFT_68805 [Coprinellus micaceus]|uniref:Uncharacterized protein n=1 Tax=Coprinellus micaceus TaxID=71717 RepID=A0A4Y7TKT6_COPMI|nr:hypothetical protein FA13DRAFT_68805 [Coprinellus micaceus]
MGFNRTTLYTLPSTCPSHSEELEETCRQANFELESLRRIHFIEPRHLPQSRVRGSSRRPRGVQNPNHKRLYLSCQDNAFGLLHHIMSSDPRVTKSRQPKAYTEEQLAFLRSYLPEYEKRSQGSIRGDSKKFAFQKAAEYIQAFGISAEFISADDGETRFKEGGITWVVM